MVLAEAAAGIALFKAAVDGIKSTINTAKDVSEIGGYINQLFSAEKQIQEQRSKQASVSALDGFRDAASTVIDHKLVQEELNNVRTLVNMRFGPDTWQQILDEKNRREREAREAAQREKLERLKKQEETWEIIQMGMVVVGIVLAALFLVTIFISNV